MKLIRILLLALAGAVIPRGYNCYFVGGVYYHSVMY